MKSVIFTALFIACFNASYGQECSDPGYFRCDNGRCIPATFICDGDNDCGDGSDERDENGNCPECPGHFQCASGKCIYSEWVCDGDNDCGDAGDEQQDCPPCAERRPERPFTCKNGVCISPWNICDGSDNCGDRSDEQDENGSCPECPEESFVCTSSGQCLPRSLACNGRNECGDWSDETEEACPCADEEMRCSREDEQVTPGACIPPEWVCDDDGIWDCPNGDDEANCTISTTARESKVRSR